jgi:hypothetical protein
MRTLRLIGMAIVAVIMCVNFTACSDDDDEEQGGNAVVGTWSTEIYTDGDYYTTLITYNADGSCTSKEYKQNNPNDVETDKGKYQVDGNKLSIWWESEKEFDEPWTCTFTISGKRMTTSENGGTVWIKQ